MPLALTVMLVVLAALALVGAAGYLIDRSEERRESNSAREREEGSGGTTV
jgi:hypothetical protein